MKIILLALYLFPAIIICQGTVDFSGTVNYYYISRLSDGSLINLPFRIAKFTIQKEQDNFSIYSNLAMEYRIPSDSHFLDNTSPQDFSWELLELYLTWQLKNTEIRIGKQIHSWGSTDGNSPVDNLNANDYYYLFESGAEQKIGAFSTAVDYFLDSWKFGLSISPIHQTNRLPINDPEFPVDLPVSPRSSQIIEVDNPIEVGGFITKSFNKGDVTLSYFNGHDRIFSLSGANVYTDNNYNKLDTVFCYRKTEMIGFGGVFFLGNLTLRGDLAYFNTKDPNDSIDDREYTDLHAIRFGYESEYTTIRESHPFLVNAEYYQLNLQFEYDFFWDINIAGQYIKYDTLKYSDNPPPIIELPNFDSDIKPSDVFAPGMGIPIASLSKNVVLLDLTKTLYDNQVELSLRTMIDQVYSGKLIELGFGYDISEAIKCYLAINKIIGDTSADEMYTFNHMEDFSHIRLELRYFY